MGAKYRVGSITPVTFFAVFSIFFICLYEYLMACMISLKMMYVYRYCEYYVKLTLNRDFFDFKIGNSNIP